MNGKSWCQGQMSRLLFSIPTLIREARSFGTVASEFLDSSAVQIIRDYISQLENMQFSPGNHTLVIRADRPLTTSLSAGGYEVSARQGGRSVFATTSSVWDVSCDRAGAKRSRPISTIQLEGRASTVIQIFEQTVGGKQVLSTWQADLGDAASPGCHFHVQVQRSDEQLPYPSDFPVPRFPSLLTTPFSVAEFVIAELFQDEWQKNVARPSADLNTWSNIQKFRLERLLDWQCGLVKTANTSPWSFLKAHKPEAGLFV